MISRLHWNVARLSDCIRCSLKVIRKISAFEFSNTISINHNTTPSLRIYSLCLGED